MELYENNDLLEVGAGLLSLEFMEKNDKRLFKIYENIVSQVENIRSTARKHYQNKSKDDNFFKSPNRNNTISVLGERGAGKTSLILTFLNELVKNSKDKLNENIIFPIIEPEKFSSEKEALGWIIFNFKKIIDNLHKTNRDYCTEKDQKFTELLEKYNTLKRNYVLSRESAKREISNFVTGKSEYTKLNEDVIFANMNLSDSLNEFIELLIDFIKDGNDEKQPLIFISFDDIDLCPEQGVDILKTIMEYLSHPAIVTIVMGDVKNFRSGIVTFQAKKTKIYDLEIDRQKSIEKASKIADELLKKGLPYIFRNEIRKMSFDEIMDFIPYGDKKKYGHNLLSLLKEIKFDEKSSISLLTLFDKIALIKNIKCMPKTKALMILFSSTDNCYYSSLLPNKPRELINFYFILQKIIYNNHPDEIISLYINILNLMNYKNDKDISTYVNEVLNKKPKQSKVSLTDILQNYKFYCVENSLTNKSIEITDSYLYFLNLIKLVEDNLLSIFNNNNNNNNNSNSNSNFYLLYNLLSFNPSDKTVFLEKLNNFENILFEKEKEFFRETSAPIDFQRNLIFLYSLLRELVATLNQIYRNDEITNNANISLLEIKSLISEIIKYYINLNVIINEELKKEYDYNMTSRKNITSSFITISNNSHDTLKSENLSLFIQFSIDLAQIMDVLDESSQNTISSILNNLVDNSSYAQFEFMNYFSPQLKNQKLFSSVYYLKKIDHIFKDVNFRHFISLSESITSTSSIIEELEKEIKSKKNEEERARLTKTIIEQKKKMKMYNTDKKSIDDIIKQHKLDDVNEL